MPGHHDHVGSPRAGDETTSDLLLMAARSMRRAFGEAMATYGVTPSQARALRLVVDLGSARPSVLAEQLRIAPRSATEVVDALEGHGLVARQADPGDRRATLVVPTSKGRKLRRLLDRARRDASEERLAVLDDAERADLDRLLRLLAAPGE